MYSGGFGREGSLGKKEKFVSGGGVEDFLRGDDVAVEWLRDARSPILLMVSWL
jgi:hypothetical protein